MFLSGIQTIGGKYPFNPLRKMRIIVEKIKTAYSINKKNNIDKK